MRKINLIELVIDFLAGGDAPDDVKGKYHPEIIANHLALAYNEAVLESYLEGKAYSDYSILDAWARNYPINIIDSKVIVLRPPKQP